MAGVRRFDADSALEAAMRAFWERGYEGASIGALEAATGLGRQSLYGAFGDKAALFARALDRYAETVAAPIFAALDGEDPAAAIEAFFARQRGAAREDCPAGCLFAVAAEELGPRDDLLGWTVRALQAAALIRAEAAFARWRDAGLTRPDLDPAEAAALLLALQRGVAALDRAAPDGRAADAATRAAVAAVRGWALGRI